MKSHPYSESHDLEFKASGCDFFSLNIAVLDVKQNASISSLRNTFQIWQLPSISVEDQKMQIWNKTGPIFRNDSTKLAKYHESCPIYAPRPQNIFHIDFCSSKANSILPYYRISLENTSSIYPRTTAQNIA